MDTLYTLIENGVLELGNVFESCIRWLGWGLITLLAKLVNGIESTANKVYTINGFFNSSEVNQLIDKYEPLVWTVLAISIGILGFRIIFNRQQNRNELPSNILFSILVVVLLSTFMTKMNDITKVAISSINNSNQSLTDTLVKESLYDIYYLDDNDFNLAGEKNNISADSIYNIDINEALDTSEVKDSDLFKKKIIFKENGDKKLVKLEKGWFSIDEMYYRYNIDFISVIISLGAIGIAFVCIMLKVIRLLFELAFNKLFITLLAFADISDGKRLKEMVKHIISIFIVIFITAVLTNMYMLYNSWITKSLVANGLGNNGILKILFIVGGAIAVIDGPNLVERILGIDAGLKSSWGTLMAGYGVTKGALNSGKLLAGVVPKLGNGLALGMAGASGAMSGMFAGKDKNNIPNKENDSDIKKQDKTVDSQPSQMKASKDNEVDLNTINDKFKDIEELKNNSDNDINTKNKNRDKAGILVGESLQDQMKASKNNKANLNSLNDKFKDIENLRNNPNKDFDKNNIEANKSKGLDGKTVQEGMKAVKNNASNLSSLNDKFKDIENLRNNPNKDFDKNNIEANKTKGLEGQTMQEGMKGVKNNESNLSSLNNKFKDIESPRNNPNKDFDKNNIEANKSKGLEGQAIQEGMKAVKNSEANLNSPADKFKDIGDSINSINKNNTDSVGMGNAKENINTKNIKSNTEDKTNVATNNNAKVANESTNNNNNSEINNGGRKEVKGQMEDRTIGQYMKDKVQGSRFVDNINRAYSLGYNTTSKWDIKNRNKGKKGRKK
ncbi:MAG: pLS20_p028 family conjugation system transmembrane protein [Clostridium sp.]|uniref:pLS20_p028 family conjugation system transmembrane protein n=1 Tax=Clostridium sp. TaxID=1506 RepID=UPI00399AF191